MTTTSLVIAAPSLTAHAATQVELSALGDVAEREGLALITSDDLKKLTKRIRAIRVTHPSADEESIESKAVELLALLFAKHGTDNRLMLINVAAKKAYSRVSAQTQTGNRVRVALPSEPEHYTLGNDLTEVQKAAISASVKTSKLAPVQRGYAKKAKGQSSNTGAEATLLADYTSESLTQALNLMIGPELVDALHDNYVGEVRSTRNSKNVKRGDLRSASRIEWQKVTELVDGSLDRGTLRYQVRTAARRATNLVNEWSI